MAYSGIWKASTSVATSRAAIARLAQVVKHITALHPAAARALPDHVFLASQVSKVERLGAQAAPDARGNLDRDFDLEAWLWRGEGEAGEPTTSVMESRQTMWLAETMTLTNHVLAFSVARQMARTVRGAVAYVPEIARAGDEVCLLAGGPMAYVLRPLHDGAWQFVGEAYVHGIMNGEAWPVDTSALREFVLC
jgi:hypothetical protein